MKFFRIVRRRVRRLRRRTKVNDKHYELHKEQARALVHARLAYWNQFYNFEYVRVAIRNQSTRWGSCSTKKNLNFNYRIALVPVELADYIIVHELCHLKEFNHSARFWALVAETLPDYTVRKRALSKVDMRVLHATNLGYNASHTLSSIT